MSEEIKGYVHSLESFGSVDGPGVRYVIFLSGCAMRCQFCHNPDTWKMGEGQQYTPSQLLKQALRYKNYWGNKGGITVSGGEPLLQIDFLIEFFRQAKAAGVHTTLDTSANPYTEKEPFYSKWLELMKYTDLVLLDIKQIDEEEHIKLTGQSNKNILAMARKLSDMGKTMWIRHVLVPGGSDKDEYLHRLADFIHTLKQWRESKCFRTTPLGYLNGNSSEFLIRWKVSDHHQKNESTTPEKFWERYKPVRRLEIKKISMPVMAGGSFL